MLCCHGFRLEHGKLKDNFYHAMHVVHSAHCPIGPSVRPTSACTLRCCAKAARHIIGILHHLHHFSFSQNCKPRSDNPSTFIKSLYLLHNAVRATVG